MIQALLQKRHPMQPHEKGFDWQSFTETISLLKKVIQLRDFESTSHVERIGHFSYRLAQELGFNEVFCRDISYASQLHDIGKLALPDSLLNKQGALTPDEFKAVKTHTVLGQKMLGASGGDTFRMACDIALCHHERWDGTGYPFGIKGEDIPVSARIVMLVDQYDALRSKRPYKDALSHTEVCDILLYGDNRTMPYHFDPNVFSTFKQINSEFESIFDSYNSPGPVNIILKHGLVSHHNRLNAENPNNLSIYGENQQLIAANDQNG